jgi:hypothetical protein
MVFASDEVLLMTKSASKCLSDPDLADGGWMKIEKLAVVLRLEILYQFANNDSLFMTRLFNHLVY